MSTFASNTPVTVGATAPNPAGMVMFSTNWLLTPVVFTTAWYADTSPAVHVSGVISKLVIIAPSFAATTGINFILLPPNSSSAS